MSRLIGILAGEPSGDNLGAGLMAELKALDPDVRFVGVGGSRMVEQGLDALHDIERLSINGFVEPIRRLPELLKLLTTLRDELLERRVDAFVGIDFNVFNLLLERSLKKRGVPTVHYVSPSVYAWRRGRVKRVSQSADVLLTLYPFEPAFYEGLAVQAEYVGHPLAHEITEDDSGPEAQAAARDALGLTAKTVVAILPGSRRSEVTLMGPIFFEAARQIQSVEDVQFVVPCLRDEIEAQVRQFVPLVGEDRVVIDRGNARRALTSCDAAIVKSGTSTLEAMCLAKPMVVSYKLGKWSYQLARRLVRTPFIALPNILAGKELVPELLQDAATPEALAAETFRALERARTDSGEVAEFRRLYQALKVGPRASAAAAGVVHRFLEQADHHAG